MNRLDTMLIGCCTFLFLIVLGSCNSDKTRAGTPGEGDFMGFELVQMGDGVTMAIRKDDAGAIVERGYIQDGEKHGMWTTLDNDGKITSIKNYINGQLDGYSLQFDRRNQIENLETYTTDILDGNKVKYRFGRPQEVIPYDMGVIDGKVRRFHNNGKIKEEIDYKNGKQDGYYRHYNESEQLDLEYVYKNGEKISGGIVSPEQQDGEN